MIPEISWKNIWRNKTRSLIVITAVTLGIISGVLLVGIMQGWVEQRIHDAIHNEVSHVQIHNAEYYDNEDILSTIDSLNKIISVLESDPEVKAWTERTKLTAIATTPWASTGLFIYGINPQKEKEVSEIYTKIVPNGGEYPDINKTGYILISDKTAEILQLKQYIITEPLIEKFRESRLPDNIVIKLDSIKGIRFRSPKEFKAILEKKLNWKELDMYGKLIMDSALDYRIRNRIQITLSDCNGNPVQGTFRLCGIYKTTNTGFDQASAFVNINELAELYGSDTPLVHEIAIMLHNAENIDNVKNKLSTVTDKNIVHTWKELAPDAAMMNDFMYMYYFIFIGIIMLALAFGIINTMLMAILERTKELGMLMAIGMNRKRIFSMIMLETIFLTSAGAVAGMLAGWVLVSMLGKTGIHFSSWGEGFEAIGYSANVYPVVTFDFFIFVIAMVVFTAVLSSIWPARKALKLNPVETLRTE
ncbi:MAG TPA: FtsX-like permease family protein [Bacteroidales bacterium]|nr:FtsX-like permease family protein [Bacteroidales bacterium]